MGNKTVNARLMINLLKKSISKSSPGRLSSSAKLSGIKGSESQRSKMAYDLNNKFFDLINDQFEAKIKTGQKAKLNNEEILSVIKKVIPDVNVSVKKFTGKGVAMMETIFDKQRKKAVKFELLLKNGITKGVNESDLRHEMRHLLDAVTQPKYTARNNTMCLVGRLKNYSDKIDDKHFEMFDKLLYAPKKFEDSKMETIYVKETLNEYFKKSKTPTEEKIEILQKWRYDLKTEVNAYIDEAQLADKLNPKRYIKETVGEFFLLQKIEIIEEILKKEITGARKLNAENIGKKPVF